MLFIVCGVTRLRQKVFAGMKMDPMGGMGKKKCASDAAGSGVLRSECCVNTVTLARNVA